MQIEFCSDKIERRLNTLKLCNPSVTDRKEMFVRKSSEEFLWILYKRIKKSF